MRYTYRQLLQLADHHAAELSDDPARPVGAIIVNHHREILSRGTNRLPGIGHDHRRVTMPLKRAFLEHAERDAILNAARWGIRLNGSTMVAPWAACADCARAIIAAGIGRLVRRPVPESRWNYSIELGDLMMREIGVDIVELDL